MIQLQDVSFAYPLNGNRSRPVLRGVHLHVNEGEFVCVLGPSGCGKTTLLNLIAGFLVPGEGTLLFAGQPIRAPGPERAVVFQDPTLFPWLTAQRNVEFGLRDKGLSPSEIRARAEEAMRRTGLIDCEQLYPHALSGGMRQRVALARVLALQPRALLMDEPFGALDVQMREQLQDELLQICQPQRQTVLFVTHNVEEAAYLADRVLLFGPPPGGVRAEMTVTIPRPRQRTAAAMRDVCALLRQRLDEIIASREERS